MATDSAVTRDRLPAEANRWVIVAQSPMEERAVAVVDQFARGDSDLSVGEWEIVVREDKRRARTGGAFVVWARRVDDGVIEERIPAGRWLRAVRVWQSEGGPTVWVESPEDPAGESIRGMPPRIVDEDLRRQVIDRLPRAPSLGRGRRESLPDR